MVVMGGGSMHAPICLGSQFYETELPGVERGKPGAVEARASRPVARTRCVLLGLGVALLFAGLAWGLS